MASGIDNHITRMLNATRRDLQILEDFLKNPQCVSTREIALGMLKMDLRSLLVLVGKISTRADDIAPSGDIAPPGDVAPSGDVAQSDDDDIKPRRRRIKKRKSAGDVGDPAPLSPPPRKLTRLRRVSATM